MKEFFLPKPDGVAVPCSSYKLLINKQLLLKFSASATQSENNYVSFLGLVEEVLIMTSLEFGDILQ